MNCNFVFEANSAYTFHINSRLQSHHVTYPNFLLLASANPRPFVDFNAQAVSRAVDEVRSEAMPIEKAPCGPVNASGGDTGAKSVMRGLLGLLHRFVPSPNTSGRVSQKNRARQITAVVAEYSTQVQDHQFVFLQPLFRRPSVWQSGTRSRGDNGLERRTARAFAAHTVINFRRHFQFCYTWSDEIRRLADDFGSKLSGAAHHIEFLSGFYLADALDEFRGRFPFDLSSCCVF